VTKRAPTGNKWQVKELGAECDVVGAANGKPEHREEMGDLSRP